MFCSLKLPLYICFIINTKTKIMKATVSFKIPEFNSFGTKEINFKEKENSEATFKEILKSLNKTLTKNWESIEFTFNCSTFLVCRHWLIETNFNWEESHEIQ